MKLLRFGDLGSEKPGILDSDGQIRDLSSIIQDINPSTINDETFTMLQKQDLSGLPVVSADHRIGACVGNVGKMICIGLNYSDHAAETGATAPPEPIIFMKVNSAICGPNDDVRIPKTSEKTDWEVELGFVIGKTAKYVSEDAAMEHVAGYCIVNDVSERSYQFDRGGQWIKGKSAQTFAPIGPFLVTAEEIENPQNLNLKETISNLDQQKNQLEIEKKELETNYEELQQNYQKLKSKIDELNNQKEVEVKKELEFSDKIDELNQETDSLLEEIDKWQM